ncbi:ATP-binding protein [Streptosporangium soli]|nr:ATP-binding protein [Streptosporangium sp. KLBMP 9127]
MQLHVAPEQMEHIRRIVRSQLAVWKRSHLADDAALGVNELLANVHKHASSNDCTLLLRPYLDGVHIRVSDTDRRKPEMRQPSWDSQDGHGLHLVAAMSRNWGCEVTNSGKDVWFSLMAEGGAS